jgi:outer membrane immunogenic protein
MRARHVLAALSVATLTALLCVLTGTAPALAGAACNIELSAGVGVQDTALSAGGPSIDLAQKGALGGLGFGCDVISDSTKVGVQARYSAMNVNGSIAGADIDADGLWEVAGKLAWRLNDKFDVYGRAGWAGQTKMKLSSGGSSISAGDHSGLLLGAGMEVKLTGPWSMFGEYTWYNLGSESIGSTGVTAEPDLHVVRVGVKYAFGTGSSIFTNEEDPPAPRNQPLK